ncbi:16S rRNA (guanine(527)-N(7))-methyltransferase RsmG [Arachidicoccus soli]|uniref:16S rRNA (guanine(527)-N(7))-methyltransferase RsmG n=1 Tax=Arachidicoccus soli TaxID=2341117 RepID=UPI001F09E90E|nr:16S rRNA (guanine(527)-N(7))-methyltransferase RsmG [Arachidicoccus soli]
MIDILQKYFADFTEKQIQQFIALQALYEDWNGKINVISRKDISGLYERHVLHSLAIAATVEFRPGTEIIDIGCGGGFPGIPLAIFFPSVQFHLVDSINKKLTVVNEVASAIGLQNITTQHARAESIKDRKFDFAVSRAVAPLKDLWFWSKPLLKKLNKNEIPNGLICLKGGDLAEEISDSTVRPKVSSLEDLFEEDFFQQKYILYVER